ncbi:MAG: hypothetical protein QW702_03890 [Candidatus Bathyarchaeia archaeon]
MNVFRRMGSYFSRLGAAFALLWIMMFTITFSDSLCSPVVPYMVREFLMEESAVVVMLGLLSFTFNLVKTAANFPGALLGDKIDRRVIVLSAWLFCQPHSCSSRSLETLHGF